MDHRNAAPRSAPPSSVPDEGSTAASAPTGSEASPGTEAATTTTAPARPTDADAELLAFAQRLELTARDLYDVSLRAGANQGDLANLFVTLRENHEEYATSISALLGVRAPQHRDDDLFAEHEDDFKTDDPSAVAYDLESTLLATHLDLVFRFESIAATTTTSGLLLVIARHCTVLADAAGNGDDLDALLVNSASALAPSASLESVGPSDSEPAEA